MSWNWDPSLYSGSAHFYARGRMPYPSSLATTLAAELALDGTGRLLDIGCGPGSLTLLLANHFAHVVGLDADHGMLAVARSRAPSLTWVHLRAEDLPADLGTFDVVTFAQSFHWLDRPAVASTVRDMLTPDGVCVHVGASTHRGDPVPGLPQPPHDRIGVLVRAHLGPLRRAGQGVLLRGTASGEEEVYAGAGFRHAGRLSVPGQVITRDADDVVASVFSLSSSAPHLFGERLPEFESRLRALLHEVSPSGEFAEHTRDITLDLWRP
ncbi:SAM-dependent methyltransferase [Crossiella equi]|uniref:SAM-dependent methyltransferase n=1 Tax=Crossiella equi TaxID=130796 RepID=A0ABS5ASB6_9PSEU|nr:class I SAM-dependent methyltransferase [Crossiella equi]MBP2478585.1 SAM-dependent methyltransferase [Crossiella equi]